MVDPVALKECVKRTSVGYSSKEVDQVFLEISNIKPLILEMLMDMASQSEASGDFKDKFRANAYRKVVKNLKPKKISPFYFTLPAKKFEKTMKTIGVAGLGKKTAEKIYEFVYNQKTPVSGEEDILIRRELKKVWGAGPPVVTKWMLEGVRSIDDLKRLTEAGDIVLTNQQTLGLKYFEEFEHKIPFREASIFYELVDLAMKTIDPKAEVYLVGSFARGDRKKVTSSDIDILVLSDKIKKTEAIIAAIVKINSEEAKEEFKRELERTYRKGDAEDPTQVLDPEIYRKYLAPPVLEMEIGTIGPKQVLGVMRNPLGIETNIRRFDIFLQPLSEKVPAIFSRRASGPYNKEIRAVAKKLDLKLNEKGLWEKKEGSKLLSKIPLKSEEELYEILKLPWVDVDDRV